ncbi:DNA polymerase mu [Flammula alnicola]|nr:DNA polymerase mu [Flammula alnicola]
MPKRPSAALRFSPASSSASDHSDSTRSPKRFRSNTTGSLDDENEPLKVYIVQEKLDDKMVRELFDLVEATSPGQPLSLELCSKAEDADIIITSIRMKKRLQRHVDWNIAKQKSIVTPDWLRESVKRNRPVECGRYAALAELRDQTVAHCPVDDSRSDQSSQTLVPEAAPDESPTSPPEYKIPTVKPTNPRVFNNWTSHYSCARASPLVCVNQALVKELGILCQSRELEGLNINALSYERSVSTDKTYPYLITQETYARDIVKLPGLGDKTLSKIEEFIKKGYIEESQTTKASERFQSLSLFATIYGIGPSNARKLYDLGLRTIEDLERYYDVYPGSSVPSLEDFFEETTPNGRRIPRDKLPDMSIKIALALREDFDIPISREEVEEMHRVVMKELHGIQPGCVSTVVGGYRRGKQQSNDVDIVISHPDLKKGADIVKGLCNKLTKHLYARGMVTHVMHLSGFHAHNALRTEHWDSLEKALTVFRLPPDDQGKHTRLHRRLDLIFATPAAYWTAVVGWQVHSCMFERDLRRWAKVEKGMKFDSSGMTRRHDSKLFIPRSEEEVFDILGLDWVDPTMRNADV